MSLHDVIRHLVQYGPARNERERDHLLGQLDEDEQGTQAPATITVAEQKAAGVPPEDTVTIADQKAGAEVHPAAAEALQSEGD